MADSAAAIVKINITKICPIISSKYVDTVAKVKLTPSNNSSIDIKIVKMFLRLSITPNNPMKNTVAVRPKI